MIRVFTKDTQSKKPKVIFFKNNNKSDKQLGRLIEKTRSGNTGMRVGALLLILCALEGHARNNSVSIDLLTQMTWTNSLKETNDQNSLKKKNMILCLANTIILVVETFKNKMKRNKIPVPDSTIGEIFQTY